MAGALLLAGFVACGDASPNAQPPNDAGPDVLVKDAARTDAGHPLCVDGKSVDGVYPAVKYQFGILETPPDLSFKGAPQDVALHDYFEPCAAKSRLLVIRVGAPWCGTCLWHLKHTGDFKKLDVGSRLQWLDLQVSNRDNDAPTLADLSVYRTLIDTPETVALDPSYQLGAVDPGRGPLPLVILVDTRTMRVRNYMHDPDPQLLEVRMRQELAELDGGGSPSFPKEEKFDGIFFRNQWDLLHDMTVPGAPPADPTNAKADDPAAAAFGKQLFFDKRLSPSGNIACASCHDDKKDFQDGLPQSTAGISKLDRNSPAIALAAHSPWQFWDGRADTLWMQALGPFENDKEFGGSRLHVVHATLDNFAAAYSNVFGPAPDLSDLGRFPAGGKPGDASWQSMTTADQKTVTAVFVNVGKAIAAYERTLRVKPNKLDAYIGGDLNALSTAEKGGLAGFFGAGCVQCHWGPRLTDDAFHPDRYPTGRQDTQADRGRIDGVGQLLASEFAQPHPGLTSLPAQLGSFKTTGLRGIAGSAPFGHGGTLATLQDVARAYGTAGIPLSDPRAVGDTEPWLPQFAQTHADELVPFLQVLTAEPLP
ncbi:MAG: cytochrome c peroxidase [Polyangiaceae bacterium]